MGLPIRLASKSLPDWYKKRQPTPVGTDSLTKAAGNFKHCVPFLDVMSAGYIVELTQDVTVRRLSDGNLRLQWPIEKLEVAVVRESATNTNLPTPAGHDSTHFAWVVDKHFKTPKGWSLLYTHPFNQSQLPFTTLSGLVDSDSVVSSGKLPFYIRDDFEGLIPAGTPIVQLLPIKRDSWVAKEDQSIQKIGRLHMFNAYRHISGWYKKNIWIRKEYT